MSSLKETAVKYVVDHGITPNDIPIELVRECEDEAAYKIQRWWRACTGVRTRRGVSSIVWSCQSPSDPMMNCVLVNNTQEGVEALSVGYWRIDPDEYEYEDDPEITEHRYTVVYRVFPRKSHSIDSITQNSEDGETYYGPHPYHFDAIQQLTDAFLRIRPEAELRFNLGRKWHKGTEQYKIRKEHNWDLDKETQLPYKLGPLTMMNDFGWWSKGWKVIGNTGSGGLKPIFTEEKLESIPPCTKIHLQEDEVFNLRYYKDITIDNSEAPNLRYHKPRSNKS
jgi:hypothetical protein